MHVADEDLVETRELTQMAHQNTRYSDQQGLQVVQNFDVLGAEGLFLFCTSLRVSRQGISSSISLALMIIVSEVVAREFLGPADLSGVQTLRLHELMEVVVVDEYEHLMLRPFYIVPPSLKGFNDG